MDSDTLKLIVQNLFDFAEKALAGRPLISLALSVAEGFIMANWDKWFKEAKAAGVIPKA